MTAIELYILLDPLIHFLGTVFLVLLLAASVVAAVVWFFRTFWKLIVTFGVAAAVICTAVLVMGSL